jgi:hypothetical protein
LSSNAQMGLPDHILRHQSLCRIAHQTSQPSDREAPQALHILTGSLTRNSCRCQLCRLLKPCTSNLQRRASTESSGGTTAPIVDCAAWIADDAAVGLAACSIG